VELVQLNALPIGRPHHRDLGPDIFEPDQVPDRRPFDGLLALELEAQFDEERLNGFEIVDNDEDVVHPFKRHILPSLASPLMPVLAARGVKLAVSGRRADYYPVRVAP
jgi:hypothetical protein